MIQSLNDSMPLNDPSFKRAKDLALRFLSNRARSGREVEKKLREKEIDEETIREVITALEKVNLINDEAFAANWVEYRSRECLLGPLRLLLELEEKGVGEEIRARAVEECFQNMDEKELALAAAEKKIRSSGEISREKLKGRVFGYLQRRGFSSEAVYSAVNKLIND